MFTAPDHQFMALALQLAAKGLYTTTPNPRVGCVIVRDGKVVGEGWHQRAGEAHAEIHALGEAGQAARGATAYVTLEPCSHFGRTPPCADALINAGVSRVVAAMEDPNPRVAGDGMKRLAEAGIATAVGLLEAEARELNIGFVARMSRCRPWLRIKSAASLDGKTALSNGRSQWITGPDARRDGHRWRARACAILTGMGTVRGDDPRLTVRDVDWQGMAPRQPLKVVVDTHLEIPLSAAVLKGGHALIASAVDKPHRVVALADVGAEVVVLPGDTGRVDLPALMAELARRGINEVHGEAGMRLNGSLIREGLADELLLYLAPTLLGHTATGLFQLPELSDLSGQRRLSLRDVRKIGEDIRILARFA
jgi:diaminohydroxyphosphoribosylaminopyrimidine deaminase/5-amino-6-(5-phosphoribosylamino)uracil reductase